MLLFFEILFIPIAIFAIVLIIHYIRHKKEIDEESDRVMKEMYPGWPNVERPKTDFDIFPLNLWND